MSQTVPCGILHLFQKATVKIIVRVGEKIIVNRFHGRFFIIIRRLFGGSPADQSVAGDPLHKAAPRPITEISGKGIVQTEEEKKKAEEEARRKREAEEEEQRRLEAEEAERLRREKRENSFWNKAKRALQKFGKSMIEEEE